MKRLSPRRKKFLQRYEQWPKNYKFIFRKHRRLTYGTKNKFRRGSRGKSGIKEVLCPESFSIVANGRAVTRLFDIVRSHVENGRYVNINFVNVNFIDIDALMTLLALIRDLHYRFGNVIQNKITLAAPKDIQIRKYVENSGFFRFALSKNLVFQPEHSHFEIHMSDYFSDEDVFKICKFACNGVKTNTQKLYPILTELLTNVRQHAYRKKNKLFSHGYIFCSKKDKIAEFVLMDTGRTIPGTVTKKGFFKEFGKSDTELLLSTLKGENRSETGLPNRNRGLKDIFESQDLLLDLKIISRRGRYAAEGYVADDYIFNGTLFKFNIKGA